MGEFSHPDIPPIVGQLAYKTLASIQFKINTNTVLVNSSLGDGAHGLLALIIPPTVYNLHSVVPIVPLVNHGSTPNVHNNATNT